MNVDELIEYYDRELDYLRRAGSDFARRYPRLAQRLELQSTGSTDPHVERLIEAFAFLTARIQRKIDDDFPEITEALLSVIHPHLLSPIPSLSVLRLEVEPAQGRSTDPVVIPRGVSVRARPSGKIECVFRTCYETELWPIKVEQARVTTPRAELKPPPQAQSVLMVDLRCVLNLHFKELSLDSLRFYLHGAPRASCALYEYLLNQVTHVAVVDPENGGRQLLMGRASDLLSPVGFDADQGLLPYSSRTLHGYRLLLEYFALPQKFLFIDLKALRPAISQAAGQTLRLLFYSDQPYPGAVEAVHADSLQLGCTPIVNLFAQSAKHIPIRHVQSEYPVIPAPYRAHAIEVYSVEAVRGSSRVSAQTGVDEVVYQPFYSTSHGERAARRETVYWYARRRPSLGEGPTATDVYLSFADLQFNPGSPASEVLSVDTLCTNRELPSSLPFGESLNDFTLEGFPIRSTLCLFKPTPVRRTAMGRGKQWRLVSHLSLNYASLSDPERGLESLQELLRLYDFNESEATDQQISGICGLTCRPMASRLISENGESSLARGFDIVLEMDPDRFVGSSMFLFASVLERFLGLYVAMNAFSRLTVKVKGREGHLRRWKPRAGTRILL